MVAADGSQTLAAILDVASGYHLPWFVLGLGSNLLVADNGWRGVVIRLTGNLRECRRRGDGLECGAGASLPRAARLAWEEGLTGLEPLEGVPGTLGGAVAMNAGAFGGDMPLYRVFATKVVHPWMVRLFCDKKVTETSNGYRAMKLSLLDDPRIDIDQPWLKDYQLEMYLIMRILKLDFKTAEVPVSKIYPPRQEGNTKMTPITGWWKMLYPIILVGLGIRK